MRRTRSDAAISNQDQMKIKLCKINIVMVSIATDKLSRLFFLSVFLYHEAWMMKSGLCNTPNPQY